MAQVTEVVVPWLETELGKEIIEIKHPYLGEGFAFLFTSEPPHTDVEKIAQGLELAINKATGEMHRLVDSSEPSAPYFTIDHPPVPLEFKINDPSVNVGPAVYNQTCYLVYRGNVPMSKGTLRNNHAIIIMQSPDCDHNPSILQDYRTVPRTYKKIVEKN